MHCGCGWVFGGGDILRWGQAPVQWDDGVRAAYAELGRQGAPTRYHEIWTVQTGPMPGGNGDVAGSHIYATPGIYTITLTVTDKDGGTDSAIYQYVVVYDPSGGFVTGGGWIDSPAGRANLGINARCKRNATTPDGQTEFQFKAGDLNFHASSYDWLVVAGARAQYMGSGTVNGAGDYGFMLHAIDGGQPGGGGTDLVRMMIWEKATGTVIYDTQMGDPLDAAPTTPIDGSVVIHK